MSSQEFSELCQSSLRSCGPTVGQPLRIIKMMIANTWLKTRFYVFKYTNSSKICNNLRGVYYFCPRNHSWILLKVTQLVKKQRWNSNSQPSGSKAGALHHCIMKVTCVHGAFYIKHRLDLKASKVHQWKAGWRHIQDSIWTENHVHSHVTRASVPCRWGCGCHPNGKIASTLGSPTDATRQAPQPPVFRYCDAAAPCSWISTSFRISSLLDAWGSASQAVFWKCASQEKKCTSPDPIIK